MAETPRPVRHPHAPNRPPANKVADMAAFVLDKARDLMTKR